MLTDPARTPVTDFESALGSGDEFLNIELFATVAEAQALADRWRWE